MLKLDLQFFAESGFIEEPSAKPSLCLISGVWVFNKTLNRSDDWFESIEQVNFVSNGISYSSLLDDGTAAYGVGLCYGIDPEYTFVYEQGEWANEAYRTIDFGVTEQEVSYEFYTWLTTNAAQQGEPPSAYKLSGTWLTTNAAQQGEPPSAYKLSGTWLINDNPVEVATFSENVNFISNRENFTYMSNDPIALRYNNNRAYNYTVYEWTNDNYKIVDFGITPQEVSNGLYDWFTANATQQSGEEESTATATITYNGSVIATLYDGQTATLPCKGKKMVGDIVIAYVGESKA